MDAPVFAAACSTLSDTSAAVEEAGQRTSAQLGGAADLAFVFFSGDHIAAGHAIGSRLCATLQTDNLIGCSGESIVATGAEHEGTPAVSVWAARLPGARVLPMHLDFSPSPEGGSLTGWPDDLPAVWPAPSALFALGDPFSFPVESLLKLVNEEHPGIPVLGGMASTASQPGENLLIYGRRAVSQGCVGALVSGGPPIRCLVSQGCRPIGQPFVITKAERNVIQQLGGLPAYQRLVEVYQSLATSEQAQVRRGLHVGRVVSEYQERFEQGDFLVRNVMGVDQQEGIIAIGDYVRAGQTVQFHVRDADTADAELRQLLSQARKTSSSGGGALLFTCNGRGTRLFPSPHHDAGAIAGQLGNIPVAGFFAAGELGPIGGRNFIHGFTACVALFAPA
ncbi:MAG: FIST N-terminal domain-containing protein [Pirellulaceae bacterium]